MNTKSEIAITMRKYVISILKYLADNRITMTPMLFQQFIADYSRTVEQAAIFANSTTMVTMAYIFNGHIIPPFDNELDTTE